VRSLAAVALLAVALALAGCGGDADEAAQSTATEPATEPEAPPETTPPTTTLPPQSVPMSWHAGGAFVWHETDISPEALGKELREAGFGWVALRVHDGLTEDPVEGDWIRRFRRASGLPVRRLGRPARAPRAGGGARKRAARAAFARLLRGERGGRVRLHRARRRGRRAFRALASIRGRVPPPAADLPGGLSSYCRPDLHDLDWEAWRDGGFVFLPQAYVNDFGSHAAPATCAAAAESVFGSAVHPTIGSYEGVRASVRPERYARLLDRARTLGFSVYLAETRMTGDEWRALGESIGAGGIALAPAP